MPHSPGCEDSITLSEDGRVIDEICERALGGRQARFQYHLVGQNVTITYFTGRGQHQAQPDRGFWLSFRQVKGESVRTWAGHNHVGHIIIDEGHMIINKGYMIMNEDHMVMNKGHILVNKGHILENEGHIPVIEGHILVFEGHILVIEGHILMNKGNVLINKGNMDAVCHLDALYQSKERQPHGLL